MVIRCHASVSVATKLVAGKRSVLGREAVAPADPVDTFRNCSGASCLLRRYSPSRSLLSHTSRGPSSDFRPSTLSIRIATLAVATSTLAVATTVTQGH